MPAALITRLLRPEDLAWILSFAPAQRIGAAIRLNRTPAYGNRLDVLALLAEVGELSDSSPNRPGPSASANTPTGADVPLQQQHPQEP